MRGLVLPLSVLAFVCAGSAASAATPNTCVFTISMTSGTDVNNLDFVVDYAQTGGNVEGTPARPECALAIGGQTS